MATGGWGVEFLRGMRVDSTFEAFVEASSTALLRTAFLLTGDRQHAEDLLQTALLRAARRWSRARDAPYAYVRQVLINLSRDRIRTLLRRPREAKLPPVEALGAATPHDAVVERWAVASALAQLPVRQRQVVVLRYFEDLTVEQTAAVLGCSTGTVKSYSHRALHRLRELLTETHITEVPHVRG